MKERLLVCLTIWVGLVFMVGRGNGDDWPQFRGSQGDGQATGVTFPLEWSETNNLAWKVKIPGAGWSQPIVVGDRVIVTTAVTGRETKPKDFAAGSRDAASGIGAMLGVARPPKDVYQFNVIAIDRKSGATVWSRPVAEQPPAIPTHPSNTFATESPASDGSRVFVHFGSAGILACFSLDGDQIWKKDVGAFPMATAFGTGSSLAVSNGRLFVQCYNEKDSFLLCLDVQSGSELWRAGRGKGSSWSTPFVWKSQTGRELIACGERKVIAYDPETGKTKWELGGIQSTFSASPAANSELLLVGHNSPFSNAPLFAVKAGRVGDLTLTANAASSDAILWYKTRSGPGLSSPVLRGDYLYSAAESFFDCRNIRTGERVYRERLPKAKVFVASLLAFDDKILAVDEDGRSFLIAAGPEFRLLATNKLDDVFWSSPAPSGDSLFLRGVEHLYCIRKPKNH